ncbi:MAG: alpha/beta hydrolase [Lachnospiraceae bacterium]|nr:alpha/beta hydrolase [Lachnospiraceae bacterium]
MKTAEYGKSGLPTVVLLHGGGLSCWNHREAAEDLAADHRVILPVLDGHAGSGRPFTSIEDNAAEIIEFIDRELGGRVDVLGGLSLGAQTVLEMLSQRGEICRHAVIESAAVIPQKLTNALIGPAFGSSYGLIKQRWFARLQFKSLKIKEDLFEDYYRDSCAITKQDLTAFMKASTSYSLKEEALRSCRARVHVYAGEKEIRTVRRSAQAIVGAVPGAELTVLPGLYHGEFSLNHAREFAAALRSFLQS